MRALAMWMTWKCAVVDIPLGGERAELSVILCNLTETEQERLCQGVMSGSWPGYGTLYRCTGA